MVPDARGLTEGQMQRIARELNNSETAFLFPGKEGEYDVHVRFFRKNDAAGMLVDLEQPVAVVA